MNMNRVCLLGVIVVCCAAAELEDLAWIAGHWQGELGESVIEEVWAEPAGGTMMGMFRLVKGTKTAFYEFMAIEQTPDGLQLRLRHFHPGLLAWEEKDTPMVFRLERHADGEAVFTRTDEPKPERLIYRKEGPGGLVIVLEKEREGKKTRQEFRYRRARRR